MNLPTSLRHHPELYIFGLSTVGTLGLLFGNLDVTLRSTPADERTVMRDAAQVRSLLERDGAPRRDVPDLVARIGDDLASVSAPRANPDGTAYYQTEMIPVFVQNADPSRPPSRHREPEPLPLPSATAGALPDAVELEWTLGRGALTQAATFAILRVQLTGPDGREWSDRAERPIAQVPFGGESRCRDEQAQHGCSYAYVVKLVDGERSVASAPVSVRVPLPYRFHVSGVANGSAVFQVEKYFGAARGWRKARFVVAPGAAIGGRLESTIFGDEFGPIDFSTGFVLKEIAQEKVAAGERGSMAIPVPLTVVRIESPTHGSESLRLER